MKPLFSALADVRGGIHVGAFWLALVNLIATVPALAQEPAPQAHASAQSAAPRARTEKADDAGRWDLPRLFYEPRQRRGLDVQDRALHLGLTAAATAPSGPRFDGWLSSPTGTHAWISGAPYLADRTGHLHAADGRPADPASDEMEGANAQFDRARGVLLVHRESAGAVRLRVGEADNPLDAAPMASDATPAVSATGQR